MGCSRDGCDREVHSRGAITFDVCTKHYLESMSDLRPDAGFAPN